MGVLGWWILLLGFVQQTASTYDANNASCIQKRMCDDTNELYGERPGGVLDCVSGAVLLYSEFCVTSYNATNGSELLVGGMCPCVHLLRERTVLLDPYLNYAGITEQSCGVANRTGTLCGKCVEGFSVSITDPWSFRCVRSDQCESINCFLYALAEFGPPTVMFLFVYLLGINVAAPYTFGYVTFAQIIPFYTTNLLWPTIGIPALNAIVKVLLSMYSIWTLEIFTLFIPPLCCAKNISNMNVIALKYVGAVYPLFLVSGTYLLLKLQQWNIKPVVIMTWPVRSCLQLMRIETNPSSLLTTFCTFVSLAFVKISIVSLRLLSSQDLTLANGEVVGKVLLYDGSLEFWGPEHKSHGIVAILVLLFFFLLPCLTVTLYPICNIPRYLSGRGSVTRYVQYMTAFMEVFYGHFKDGTGGSRDFRFLGGMQFIFKFILFLAILVGPTKINEDPNTTVLVIGTMVWGAIIFLLQPYKNNNHTKFEAGMMLYISLTITLGIYTNTAVTNTISQLIFFVLLFLPSQAVIVVSCAIVFVPKLRRCYRSCLPIKIFAPPEITQNVTTTDLDIEFRRE